MDEEVLVRVPTPEEVPLLRFSLRTPQRELYLIACDQEDMIVRFLNEVEKLARKTGMREAEIREWIMELRAPLDGSPIDTALVGDGQREVSHAAE